MHSGLHWRRKHSAPCARERGGDCRASLEAHRLHLFDHGGPCSCRINAMHATIVASILCSTRASSRWHYSVLDARRVSVCTTFCRRIFTHCRLYLSKGGISLRQERRRSDDESRTLSTVTYHVVYVVHSHDDSYIVSRFSAAVMHCHFQQ